MAVASANLEFLRTELGEHSELLQHLPTDQVIIQPQDHAPGAVPFMLHFGYIRDKWTTKRQSVWILLFLPARDGGSAEVKFVSYDEENKRYEWEDAANIISATTGCAAAFNLPKRLSRGKCVALVKYYFLHQLAGDERNKLDFNIPISKTFLGDLRTICRDMDETSKKVRVESQGIVNNGQDSDLSDPPSDLCSPRATQKNPEVGPVAQTTMPTTSTPPVARSAVVARSHEDNVRALLPLLEDETKLDSEASAINEELSALKEAQRELELQKEEKANHKRRIKLQKEELFKRMFKDMNSSDIFDLGVELGDLKRRKLSQ